MEKMFDALLFPDKWRVRFVMFYVKGEADLWWTTVKEKQNEPRFIWSQFKELIKSRFYPISLQKAKEK